MNRTTTKGIGTVVVILLFGSLLPVPASAQMTGGGGGDSGGAGTYALEEGERNLKFAAVPIPNYSDVLGFSLGVIGMVYYKMDRDDPELPPSASGLVGFYSENNSWVGMAFQKFHLAQDKWRAVAALGTSSFKYQFNPSSAGPSYPDIFLDYTTVSDFVFAKGSRKTWHKLYLGAEVLYWTAKVSIDPDLADNPNENYIALGVNGEWDGRDHIMYPTSGTNLEVRSDFYREALGSDMDFSKLIVKVSGYTTLGDTTRVLAGRVLTESAFGDVPFSGQAILNGNQNLRGYANGRHRGENLLTIEAEYRWNFHGKWGAVAFAGVGFVDESWSDFSMDEALPASGLGLRFRMIETYKINARVDYAWGKHDQGIYISIGEAY